MTAPGRKIIQRLARHPDTPCEAVTDLAAEAGRDGPGGLALRYVLAGALARLVLPPPARPGRADGLWRHTCFEAFVALGDGGYLEFNFAPSGRWAAYRFEGYRRGMAPLEVAPPRIQVEATDRRLEMRVALDLGEHRPLRLGLTAVIEEPGGRLAYWALRHAAGPPDFHNVEGFVLGL